MLKRWISFLLHFFFSTSNMHCWHVRTYHPRLATHQGRGTASRQAIHSPSHLAPPQVAEQRAPASVDCGLRTGPRPSASGSASARSSDSARAGALALPCSKTRPRSSGLHGRAAPPAARTARRPAPAPSRPWRPGPEPGEADRPWRRPAPPGDAAARTGDPAGGAAKFTFEGRAEEGRTEPLPPQTRQGGCRSWADSARSPPGRPSSRPRSAHWRHCAGAVDPRGAYRRGRGSIRPQVGGARTMSSGIGREEAGAKSKRRASLWLVGKAVPVRLLPTVPVWLKRSVRFMEPFIH